MLTSMCSRYSLTSPHEAVRATFGASNIEAFPPRYNIAPTQPVVIVRNGTKGQRELTLVRWGLIPSWSKDPRKLSTMINARSETAAEKPSFRGAMRHRRCIVPADGFYEWTGKTGAKQPHLIHRADGAIMAFAGLWEHWIGADGSEIETMAILTTAANREMALIHDRMPVLLPAETHEDWLDCRSGRAEFAAGLCRPAPDGLLVIETVSRALNNPRNEGPEVQARVPGDLIGL
ncbi:MAG: SOS response-associated peptidase [Hyphomicrobiaceae bacterium]|nr:SOS response-associated peptidase [Hyphomicrobiaceae bacterium]